ncbi:MAG TPA: nucleoside triphosphate pyrophosphohydrolase [bacterium]|nr:nucleoside triphosphate pyrophosphohydrolase [bacterium]
MSARFDELRDLVAFLRSERGCPWDRAQTLKSLRPHLLEEMYEVCEAIDEDDQAKLREELGDTLFLILFAARIAEEAGQFGLDAVISENYAKMRSRHAHVFGERRELAADQILDEWERSKRAQKPPDQSVMAGVPKTYPSLLKAQRIQQRAASLGFDWDKVDSVFDKIKEELREFEEARAAKDETSMKDELGDIMFSLVNLARFLGISAEDALQGTISKFLTRFSHVEKEIASRGRMTLAEMDAIWDRSKGKASGAPPGTGL